MKKKIIILSVIVVMIVISVSAWLVFRPRALGNMDLSYADPITASSSFTFGGEAGAEIKFSFASDIKGGELNIVLYDPRGSIVYELDEAKELQAYHTLNISGIYRLTAEYTDFVGKFKIAVYPVK